MESALILPECHLKTTTQKIKARERQLFGSDNSLKGRRWVKPNQPFDQPGQLGKNGCDFARMNLPVPQTKTEMVLLRIPMSGITRMSSDEDEEGSWAPLRLENVGTFPKNDLGAKPLGLTTGALQHQALPHRRHLLQPPAN